MFGGFSCAFLIYTVGFCSVFVVVVCCFRNFALCCASRLLSMSFSFFSLLFYGFDSS